MVKILLTSDLHLGLKAPFPVTEEARVNTFRKIISLATEHDMLLLAGDFFDTPEPDPETAGLVAGEFQKLRRLGIDVLYTPGDRELLPGGRLPDFLLRLNTTHVFADTGIALPYRYEKEDQTVFVYGLPALSPIITSITRSRREGFHIGLFHAELHLGGEPAGGTVQSLQKNDIKQLNLDFFALGHKHQFRLYKSQKKVIGACPGSPEPTAYGETGERHVLSITLEGDEISAIRRLTVNTRTVSEGIIDCTPFRQAEELHQAIRDFRPEGDYSRVLLTGSRSFPVDRDVLLGLEREKTGCCLQDETAPEIEALIEENSRGDSLKSEFFSLLRDRSLSGRIPPEIASRDLSYFLNRVSPKGLYDPEDWLC